MMECDSESTVPEWLIEYPETFPVFSELGLDCTCGGRSLRFLCEQNEMDADFVVAALLKAIANHASAPRPADPERDLKFEV